MPAAKAVWALDVGSYSLKALRIRQSGESYEVLDFDCIQHRVVLANPDLDAETRRDVIRESIVKLCENHDLTKDEVGIAVAGRNGFARFVKLPPVEKKGIPKIVQYEAVQQIPFDINEVVWDWQIMENPDSPDTEVGIFALKNEFISDYIDYFTDEDMKVSCVQISPMALYNYAHFDISGVSDSDDRPVIILDMGAENTTLVICTNNTVWQRSIRIGGNTFTQAIADAFKLKFRKAEKLKCKAAMSKYAKQLFTAMKPVFTDLSSEVQRSLGFYNSSGPGKGKKYSKVIAIGGGMKLQGLVKYLQKSLGVSVVKPDMFEKLSLGENVSSAQFHENVSDFGVVYGLGIQLAGDGRMDTNLLPRRLSRRMNWMRKGKWFNAAAGLMLAVSVLSLFYTIYSSNKFNANERVRSQIDSVVSRADRSESELRSEKGRENSSMSKVKDAMELFTYRDAIMKFNDTLIKCLPNEQNNPRYADLYRAFEEGDVGTVISYPRSERKQLFVTSVSVKYADSLKNAAFGEVTSRQRRQGGGAEGGMEGMEGMPGMGMPGMGMPGMGMPGMGMPGMGGPGGGPGRGPGRAIEEGGDEELKDGAGFVVLIEGYSPYGEVAELLDPPGVGDNKDDWGFVTRLENLPEYIEGAEFKLFDKSNLQHFKLDTGVVDLEDNELPAGIGVIRDVRRIPLEEEAEDGGRGRGRSSTRGMNRRDEYVEVETVLVDPMTEEEMSQTFDIITEEEVERDPSLSERDLGRKEYTRFEEPKLITRDHWFRLQAKFLWKNAPDTEGGSGDDDGGSRGGSRSRSGRRSRR